MDSSIPQSSCDPVSTTKQTTALPPKHPFDRDDVRQYTWQHGVLKSVLKLMSSQRNNLSFFICTCLFGHLIPDTLVEEERYEKTVMVFRGVVNGPTDRDGWLSAMPVMTAASTFRQGSPKIFDPLETNEFVDKVKESFHKKAVQHLLHHPAHEALVRLIVAKAIVQREKS